MCWVLGRRTTPKWWQSTWHTSTSSYIRLMAEIHCIPHPTHWQWKKCRFIRDTAEDPKNEENNNFTDVMGLGYTQCISKSFLEESPCQSHCDTYSYTTSDLDLTATGLSRLTILRHFLERSGEARERSPVSFTHLQVCEPSFKQKGCLSERCYHPSCFRRCFHQVHSCTKIDEHSEFPENSL